MPLVALPELINAARAGDLVSFPTDTLPALAIHPDRAEFIFEVKQRSLEKPLILMAATIAAFEPYWHCPPAARPVWEAVMREHWPGALTLVLPIDHPHGLSMNPLNPHSLGFRIPQHPQALEILSHTGPLATTSANRSGEAALTDLGEIAQAFPSVSVLHGDRSSSGGSGIASTVAAWQEGGWRILRAGACEISIGGLMPYGVDQGT